jgi:hypothetical protein
LQESSDIGLEQARAPLVVDCGELVTRHHGEITVERCSFERGFQHRNFPEVLGEVDYQIFARLPGGDEPLKTR